VVVPLYYAGLYDKVRVNIADSPVQVVSLDRRQRASITVDLPPRGSTWVTFRPAER
jgi:hypothetical protein